MGGVMKKLLFIFFCFVLFFNVSLGQSTSIKPHKGDKGLSFSVRGLSSIGIGGVGAGIGGKCWHSDRLVYKISFGFNILHSSDLNSPGRTKGKSFNGSFSILPGIEYHYFPTDRISPYWAAGIGFTLSRDTRDYSIPVNPSAGTISRVESWSYSPAGYLSLGIEWFIIKNLSIAGEYQVNLSYEYTKGKWFREQVGAAEERFTETIKETSKGFSLKWGTSALIATFYF
jgi:hypothetical protein